MSDLSSVYVTTGDVPFEVGAVLRCFECTDWEADADGTALPDVIRKATDHVDDVHGGKSVMS